MNRRDSSRGQALVEFALVLPLLVVMLACVIDFGWMMYLQTSLHNAVREGGFLAMHETGYTDDNIKARVAQAAYGMTLNTSGTNSDVTITTSTQTIDGTAYTIKQIDAKFDFNFMMTFVFRPGTSMRLTSMQKVMVVPGLTPEP